MTIKKVKNEIKEERVEDRRRKEAFKKAFAMLNLPSKYYLEFGYKCEIKKKGIFSGGTICYFDLCITTDELYLHFTEEADYFELKPYLDRCNKDINVTISEEDFYY